MLYATMFGTSWFLEYSGKQTGGSNQRIHSSRIYCSTYLVSWREKVGYLGATGACMCIVDSMGCFTRNWEYSIQLSNQWLAQQPWTGIAPARSDFSARPRIFSVINQLYYIFKKYIYIIVLLSLPMPTFQVQAVCFREGNGYCKREHDHRLLKECNDSSWQPASTKRRERWSESSFSCR